MGKPATAIHPLESPSNAHSATIGGKQDMFSVPPPPSGDERCSSQRPLARTLAGYGAAWRRSRSPPPQHTPRAIARVHNIAHCHIIGTDGTKSAFSNRNLSSPHRLIIENTLCLISKLIIGYCHLLLSGADSAPWQTETPPTQRSCRHDLIGMVLSMRPCHQIVGRYREGSRSHVEHAHRATEAAAPAATKLRRAASPYNGRRRLHSHGRQPCRRLTALATSKEAACTAGTVGLPSPRDRASAPRAARARTPRRTGPP